MPTAAASIRREHVEAFIAAKLARTAPSSAATRYRLLQQLFKWLDDVGEIDASPMAKMRSRSSLSSRYLSCPMIRSEACSLSGPVGTSATVATPRLSVFLDTGMRLEGMGGLRYSADDVDSSDVDLRSRVVRITAKGRREMVLPNGAKTARDLDRYIRARAAHSRAADPWLWFGKKGQATSAPHGSRTPSPGWSPSPSPPRPGAAGRRPPGCGC
jgi:site-specific recombinase XerC